MTCGCRVSSRAPCVTEIDIFNSFLYADRSVARTAKDLRTSSPTDLASSSPVVRVDADVVAGEVAAPRGRRRVPDAEVEPGVDAVLLEDRVRFRLAHRLDRAALDPHFFGEVQR